MADISITASSVLPGANTSISYGTLDSGVTVTQGQALYLKANGNLGLADSNGSEPANTFCGFAGSAGSPGQKITYYTSDNSNSAAYTCGGTVAAGDTIWLSDTPGGITKSYADIASGSTVIIVGIVNTDLTMKIVNLVGGTK